MQRRSVRIVVALVALTALSASLARATPSSTDRPTPAKTKPATTKTGIQWEVQPSTVEVFLDGKKLGRAGDLKVTHAKPGRHSIRLVKGGDETEMDIELARGKLLRFVFDFSE